MRIILALLLLLQINSLSGQSADRMDLYYKSLVEFSLALHQDSISIQKANDLFGRHGSLEMEEHYYYENKNGTAIPSEERRRFQYPKKFKSYYFEAIKTLWQEIGQIDTTKLRAITEVYDEGFAYEIAIDLTLDQKTKVYFYFNRYEYEAVYITNIYFSNGESLSHRLSGGEINTPLSHLKRYAIIDDPDGYTNIREGKGIKHPVIGKILNNQVFIFYPDDSSNWVRIARLDGSMTGYMHMSRIHPFGSLPRDRKTYLKGQLPGYRDLIL